MTVNEALEQAESVRGNCHTRELMDNEPLIVLAKEVQRLRDDARDLRRRTQQAEKAARHTVDQVRREGYPLGRVLANAGFSMLEAENKKLRRKVAYYIGEARYHRDCERLCSREYDRLKKGEA